MDIKQLAFDLKTGNAESITALLKQLLASQADCSSKILFEVLYDLKFHRDLGVVFWAKKLLNKIEVNYSNHGIDPANQTTRQESDEPPLPTRDEVLAKMASEPEAITVDELKIVCENPDETVQAALLAILESPLESTLLSFVTKQLGQLFPSEEMLIRLAPYLRHEDSRVVANTIEGIEGIKSPKTFVILTQLLDHPDNRVRSNVAVAIGRYDKEESTAVIERMLRLEGKTYMQVSACHAVKTLGATSLFPILIELFADAFLFREALSVFEALPGAESLRFLEESLAQIADEEQKQEITASIDRIRQAIEDAAKQPARKARFAAWQSR